NRDLGSAVREGRFRADLYHRLGAYPLQVPALRERGTDVLLLAGHFIERNRARLQIRSAGLTESARQALLEHGWPGNVRELEHLIGSNLQLTATDLGLDEGLSACGWDPAPDAVLPVNGLREAVDDYQRRLIGTLLQHNRGNLSATARALKIDRGNLHRLTRRLGLEG